MGCIKQNRKHSLKKVKCINAPWFPPTDTEFKEVDKSILKGKVYLFNVMCNNTFNFYAIVVSFHNIEIALKQGPTI